MPAAAAAAADTTPAAVPTTNEKEGEDSGSEDEQALMEELWPRETQPELQYEVRVCFLGACNGLGAWIGYDTMPWVRGGWDGRT